MNIQQARVRAKAIAEKIIRGEMECYKGATMIWKEIIDELDQDCSCPKELLPFSSNASAIEDIIWNREEDGGNPNLELEARCRKEIMDAAKALIQNTESA